MHRSNKGEMHKHHGRQQHAFSTGDNNTIQNTWATNPMEYIQHWRETSPTTVSTTGMKNEASQTVAPYKEKLHYLSEKRFPIEHTTNVSEQQSEVPMRGLSFEGILQFQEVTDKLRNASLENTCTTADKYPSENDGGSSGSIQEVGFLHSSEQDTQTIFSEPTHLFTQPWVVNIQDFGRELEDCCRPQHWQGAQDMQQLDNFMQELENHIEIHVRSIQPQWTNKQHSPVKNTKSPGRKVVQNIRTQYDFITVRPAQITAEEVRIREEARLNYQGIKQVCSNGGQSWFNQPSNLKSGR